MSFKDLQTLCNAALRETEKGETVAQRIIITIESDQSLIMRQRERRIKNWCDVCNEQVEMMIIEVRSHGPAVHANSHALPECGRVHLVKAPNGSVLVCLNALTYAL